MHLPQHLLQGVHEDAAPLGQVLLARPVVEARVGGRGHGRGRQRQRGRQPGQGGRGGGGGGDGAPLVRGGRGGGDGHVLYGGGEGSFGGKLKEVVCACSGQQLHFEDYRVSHLLVDLGWTDFDFVVPSHFCQIHISPGRQWNTQNPSQPNPGPRGPLLPNSYQPRQTVEHSKPKPTQPRSTRTWETLYR